jgi:hypothetical protein
MSIAQTNFSTKYFKVQIDGKGYITSMKNIAAKTNREFSPVGKPSPLLCLYNYKSKQYLNPQKAIFLTVTKHCP